MLKRLFTVLVFLLLGAGVAVILLSSEDGEVSDVSVIALLLKKSVSEIFQKK